MQPGTLGGDEIAPAKKYKQIISAENFARSFMRYMSSMSEKTNASSRVKPFFSARSLALWSSPYALFRLSFPKTNFSARAVFRDQLCDLIPQVAGIISLLLASFSHMIFLQDCKIVSFIRKHRDVRIEMHKKKYRIMLTLYKRTV